MVTILRFSTTQDGKNKPLEFPTSWSYSKLADYEQCPLKFALKHIVKVSEGDNDAFVRGNKVHAIAEKYVTATIPEAMPPELNKFETLFREVRANRDQFYTEEQWAYAKDWSVTGWFAKAPMKPAWLRCIVDLGANLEGDHVLLIDYKTGKKYATNEDQVECFGMSAMFRFPATRTVETRLWYLDSGEEVIRTYDAADKLRLKAKWNAKVEPMLNDKIFAPRKNDKCKWCAYGKNGYAYCTIA